MYQSQSKKWHWPDYIMVDGKKCACVYQDRLELEREAADNSTLRNILYNRQFAKERWFYEGQMYEDYVVSALFWKTVMYDGMTVLHLMGPSNGGKSYLAHAYAHELLGYWLYYRDIEGKVWYFFSYAEALQYLNDFKKGDVVIIDEHSKQLGQDSLAAAMKFNNTLRATRKRGVSYIVCDPEEQNMPNCQYMLRTAFYVVENTMTRCMAYTGKTHRLLGLSDWEVPLDEQWFSEMVDRYEQEKDAYLNLFARRGGAAYKGLIEKQNKMAMELWQYARDNWTIRGKGGWVKRLTGHMNEIGYDGETHATRGQVVDKVVEYLEAIYDEDLKTFDWSVEFDPTKHIVSDRFDDTSRDLAPLPYFGQTENLRDAVLDRMIELGANAEIIEAFRIVRNAIDENRYLLEEQFSEWQELFPDVDIIEDTFRITKYYGMKNYQGAVIDGWANAFEDVYSAILLKNDVPHIQGGRNSPDPDIIITDDEGEPIEVHSLKTFCNKQGYENFSYDDIADSEKELGVPIMLVVLSLVDGKLYKIPVDEKFKIDGVRIEGESMRLPKGRPRKKEERA